MAVDAIIKRGYTRDDISVLMSDSTQTKEFAVQTRSHAADGAGVGGAIGGTVGAVLAAIAAVGTTIAIPGVGLFIAGPIAAALAGAGAGGATGGVIGLLIGTGIPEHRAKDMTPEYAVVESYWALKRRPATSSTNWKHCWKTSAQNTCEPSKRTLESLSDDVS